MDTAYHNLEDFLKQEGMIIPFDKPREWTSFDVVNKVRIHLKYQCKIPKIKTGHAGTLDPLATGLLLICVGKSTRKIDSLQDLPKTYTGIFRLGQSTPSLDAETEVTEQMSVDHITRTMIDQAAEAMEGAQMQIPPVYSAIKIGGKRAYNMARKNVDIEMTPRPVVIHRFEIRAVEQQNVYFKIICSKGTYIRSVARDFGKMLGSCAYMSALRRTAIGEYHVENACTLEQLHDVFGMIPNP